MKKEASGDFASVAQSNSEQHSLTMAGVFPGQWINPVLSARRIAPSAPRRFSRRMFLLLSETAVVSIKQVTENAIEIDASIPRINSARRIIYVPF